MSSGLQHCDGDGVGRATVPAPAQLVDVRAVAEMFNVHPRTIWNMERRGDLPPAMRMKQVVRWRLSDIEEWLDGNRPAPAEG